MGCCFGGVGLELFVLFLSVERGLRGVCRDSVWEVG